MGHLTHSGEH